MVWLEEITRHLILTLRDKLTIIDENKNEQPVKVIYSQPEVEGENFVDEDLPIVAVRMYDLLEDTMRADSLTYNGRVKADETDTTIDLEKYPIPYSIYFEVLIVTEYQQDLTKILRQVQQIFPPRGAVEVEGSETDESKYCPFEMNDFVNPTQRSREKTSTESRKKRRKRTILRYKFNADLPQTTTETYYKVQTREIDLQQKLN